MSDALQKVVDFLRYLLTWWFFVEPWEQAIRVRLGKRIKLCTTGAHFRIPFLDALYMHNTRRMVISPNSQTLSSRDNKVYIVSVTVSYCILDVLRLHTAVHDPEAVVAQRVSQLVSEYILSQRSDDITPSSLRSSILENLDLSGFGLGDVEVCINNFAAVRTFRVIQEGLTFWKPTDMSPSTTRKS